MASLVSALDTHVPKQRGENEHVELGWCVGSWTEAVVQLSFQLTRTRCKQVVKNLGSRFKDLMVRALQSGDADEESGLAYSDVLYRLMLHTRDIVAGKGEYELFYELFVRMVGIGHFCQDESAAQAARALARSAAVGLVRLEGHDHGYGSWKDMKYILRSLRQRFPDEYEKMDAFGFILHLMKGQLDSDAVCDGRPSLLGRWAPRETSKPFGWIARHLAERLHPEWLKSAKSPEQRRAASVKCRVHYRQLISRLSSNLSTPQIKMCAGEWSGIDFDSDVTSITLARSKRAFEYVDKRGMSRGANPDRLECQGKYRDYIARCTSGKAEIKAARVGLVDMVKEAVAVSRPGSSATKAERDCLNEQWKTSGKQVADLGNFVCMVDTSGSMECDGGNPLHAAIGLGMRAAEKSVLGERVMTFSQKPVWINLEGYSNFIDKVACLKNDNQWGNNTNFKAALQMVADACVEKSVPPSQVKDLVLAIFSDMQIDHADSSARTMDDQIVKMFYDAGMRSKYKTPYDPPHRLFWNLRSTNGFPSFSTAGNVSMMSGFSPALLNSFHDKGMEALTQFTPWRMLLDQLMGERYTWASEAVRRAVALEPGALPDVDDLPDTYEPHETVGMETVQEVPASSGWMGWFW